MPKASKAWTQIIKRRHHLDALDVPKDLSYEVLRRARIRFDITLMLVFRLWFRSLLSSGEPWFLFVYMDASPQWRGRDFLLQASTLCGLWTANDFTLDTFSR